MIELNIGELVSSLTDKVSDHTKTKHKLISFALAGSLLFTPGCSMFSKAGEIIGNARKKEPISDEVTCVRYPDLVYEDRIDEYDNRLSEEENRYWYQGDREEWYLCE